MIDLRSDTLTRPTESMRAAMASAEVATKNGPISGATSACSGARSTAPRGWVQVRIVTPE